MGYRSSVYIQIHNNSLDEFWNLIETGLDLHFDMVEDHAQARQRIQVFLSTIEQKHITDSKVYFSDYVKWYTDGEPLLSIIESAAKEVSHGYFYRAGEDSEDVDVVDNWELSEPLHHRSCHSVACVGTKDALRTGLMFLEGIETAPSKLRREAFAELQKVLARLMEAEGLSPLPETTDFEE